MTLLAPGNLLIWLPGLLFAGSLVYLQLALKKGAVARALQFAPLGLLALALVMAVVVPRQDMAKAIRFANAHESHAGAPVTDYTLIDYAAKDAWLRMGVAEEESGEAAASGVAAELVYQPEKGIAWVILMLFLIVGSLFFLQDINSFRPARR